MTDIAKLGFDVGTEDLLAATKQLDKLSTAAAKAEVEAKKFEKTQTSASLAAARSAETLAGAAYRAAAGNKEMSAADRAVLADTAKKSGAAVKAAQALDQQASAALLAARANMQLAESAEIAITDLIRLSASGDVAAASALENAAAHDAAAAQIIQSYRAVNTQTGLTAGQMQANFTNMAAQFQDIGVTAAMGMNPLLIGMQQGSQIALVMTNAIGGAGLAGGLKLLGQGFLSVLSPVSLLTIAFVTGISYLVQWGMSAFGATEETKNLENAVSSLRDVQSQLGEMFDMVSGKIKDNTELTRVNTLMTILNAQAKAEAIKAESGDILGRARAGKTPDFNFDFGLFISGHEMQIQKKNVKDLKDFTTDYQNAIKYAVDTGGKARASVMAIKGVGQLDLRGTGLDAEQLRKAIQGDVTGRALQDMADKAMTSFNAGTLDPSLREPGRTRTPHAPAAPKQSEAEKEADRYKELVSDLNNYNDELDRNYGAVGLIGEALIEYNKQTEIQKRAAEQNIDLAKGERQAEINLMIAKAAHREQMIINEKSYRDQKATMDENIVNLQAEYDAIGMSATATGMLAFQKKLLNDETFRGITYTDQQKKDLLDTKQAELDLAEAIKKRTEQLRFDRDVTKGFFSDMMSGVRQGQSAWEAFGNAMDNILNKVIDKLLNDLIDAIFEVKDAASSGGGGGGILGAISGLLGSIGGGGGAGGFPAVFGPDLGIPVPTMPQDFVSVPTFAKGGAFTNSIVQRPTAFFAKGGQPGVMGEAGPEAIMPLQRGPDGSLGVKMNGKASQSANSQGPITFDMRGAVVTDDLLAQMDQIASDRADVAVIRNNTRNTRLKQRSLSK